jgi:aminoglycoside phosphotransferase family enzyme
LAEAEQLRLSRTALPAVCIDAILRAQQRVLHEEADLFERSAHQIVEDRGDLRPEHVCLGARPVVIDC